MNKFVTNFALKSEINLIKLAVIGEWKGHTRGAFEITRADLDSMVANFYDRKVDIVVDYEHQTLSGEIAPAAGWIKELYIHNDELIGKVEWTTKATNFIQNGEYKYISPVYSFASIDNKTGIFKGATLHSVALTNTPFLDELGEVIANKNLNTKEEKMDNQDTSKLDEILAREIESLKSEISTQNELIANKDKQIEALNDELQKQNDLIANTKVEAALTSGKILATQKEWALAYCKKDLEGFDSYLKIATKTAPQNDMFANKTDTVGEIDIIKIATGVNK